MCIQQPGHNGTVSSRNCSSQSSPYNQGQNYWDKLKISTMDCPCTITTRTHLDTHYMSDNIPLPTYKYLTDVQVMQCLTLSHTGWKICAIATEVGCSKTTV